MDYVEQIEAAGSAADQLEVLYRAAEQAGEVDAFRGAILASYESSPENMLYAAWFKRLQEREEDSTRRVHWIAAVPLSILTGLIFWLISDVEYTHIQDQIPVILHWWSPIATMSALVFLVLTSCKRAGLALSAGLGLLAVTLYAILLAPTLGDDWKIEQYLILALIHIPLLSWAALGISVLGFKSSPKERFAFLIKSIEVMITAGLFLIAGVAFGGITVSLFAALNITLSDIWMRLIIAGGVGLLPVLALATVYDPTKTSAGQDFDQGLSKFIATMMRLLLPLTLFVLAVYIIVIPFNFMEPFENRDLLIVYNLMLFAIMGLLLGATPIRATDLPAGLQRWLRRGIISVASLVVLVSVYALAAIIFRTIEGGWTLNRLTVVGWNAINIGLLAVLLTRQLKHGREQWTASLYAVFNNASIVYLAWALFLLVVMPLLF